MQTVPAGPPVPSLSIVSTNLATGTAAISGVVEDATTGRPVAGATVSVRRWLLPLTLPRVLTDSRGRFVLTNLPPGDNYFLDAVGFGYTSTRYGWSAPGGPLTLAGLKLILLSEGQWVSNIKIPLWRLGTITGRVTDERNESVVGVAVRAFTMAKVAGRSQLVAGPVAVTDDRGVYRLANLDPARYMVAVLSVQSTALSTTPEMGQRRPVGELESGGIMGGHASAVSALGVDVDGRHRLVLTNFATPPPPSGIEARAYPALFYPAARSVLEAAAIDIGYGESRVGIDVQLRPASAVRVSGRLEGFSGLPPQLLLRMMPAGNEQLGFGSEAATTLVESDGTFTFLNVPDGNYTILAQASVMDFDTGGSTRFADAPGFPGGGIAVGAMNGAPGLSYLARNGQPSAMWGRVAISVGRRAIPDAVLELHPTVTVQGRLVFSEGTAPPAPETRLALRAQPANGDPTLGQFIGTTEGGGSFRFSIAGLMGGRYLLTAPTGYAIVSVVSQGHDVVDAGLDATSGQDLRDVVVTLTDKPPRIDGYVTDPRPAALSAVIAFPVESSRWSNFGWEARRFCTTRVGANGAYQLTRLPAGDYFLIAVDTSKIDAWQDPAFLAAAAPLATKVSLGWTTKVVQDLTVKQVIVK